MRKGKQVLTMLLAGSLIATALSGCNGSKGKSSDVDINSIDAMTENVMPITTEDLTLTIWTKNGSQGYAAGYDDYKVVKALEEKTGINLEFIHPVGAAKEQLNIMIASGDMPDIVSYYFTESTLEQVEDGTYLDLTEYVKKLAPNFNKKMEQDSRFKEGIEALGDKLTYMPMQIDDISYNAYNGYFVRKDWLDKVGLSTPETISDWETMLKAFKSNNLGSGDSTVPFATITDGSMNYEIFTSAFGLSSILNNFVVDENGKISHNVLLPGYKDYVKTMNKWYQEGLIDPNVFASSVKQIDSMMLNGELGSVFIDNNNDIPKYMMAKPELSLTAVSYPKADDGKLKTSAVKTKRFSGGFVVPTASKHPVEAVRFLDYLYSDEASDLINWGIEGETYTKDENGNKKYTDMVLSDPDGKTPTEVLASTYFARGGFATVQYLSNLALEENYPEDVKTQKNASVQYALELDAASKDGDLFLTLDDLKALEGKTSEVTSYITEMHQKFILGKEPIENIDSCIETARAMGLDEIVKVYQSAYDRLHK